MRKLSIIIPCWITTPELETHYRECVASIRAATHDFELILVDNGSPRLADIMRADADTYVRNRTNLGYAPAVNQGFFLARGEYVCVMNDDVAVARGWDGMLMQSCGNGISCPYQIPLDEWNPQEGRADMAARFQRETDMPTFEMEPFEIGRAHV